MFQFHVVNLSILTLSYICTYTCKNKKKHCNSCMYVHVHEMFIQNASLQPATIRHFTVISEPGALVYIQLNFQASYNLKKRSKIWFTFFDEYSVDSIRSNTDSHNIPLRQHNVRPTCRYLYVRFRADKQRRQSPRSST